MNYLKLCTIDSIEHCPHYTSSIIRQHNERAEESISGGPAIVSHTVHQFNGSPNNSHQYLIAFEYEDGTIKTFNGREWRKHHDE